jgi:septum formation protein
VSEVTLASGSPRRKELLGRLGLEYEVRAADVDETPRNGERPTALAVRLAESTARRVAEATAPGRVVIAADTVVARGRTLYGKPSDREDAAAMLRSLAGRGHRVITGVSVAYATGVRTHALASQVRLRPFSDAEVVDYVASGDPLDKAGAYAVQNERFRPVARLRGCRCNVVGFPLGVVAELLTAAGVALPVPVADACPYRQFSPERCCTPPP